MKYLDILRSRIEEQKKVVGGDGIVAMTCNEVLGLIQAIEAAQHRLHTDACPECEGRGWIPFGAPDDCDACNGTGKRG